MRLFYLFGTIAYSKAWTFPFFRTCWMNNELCSTLETMNNETYHEHLDSPGQSTEYIHAPIGKYMFHNLYIYCAQADKFRCDRENGNVRWTINESNFTMENSNQLDCKFLDVGNIMCECMCMNRPGVSSIDNYTSTDDLTDEMPFIVVLTYDDIRYTVLSFLLIVCLSCVFVCCGSVCCNKRTSNTIDEKQCTTFRDVLPPDKHTNDKINPQWTFGSIKKENLHKPKCKVSVQHVKSRRRRNQNRTKKTNMIQPSIPSTFDLPPTKIDKKNTNSLVSQCHGIENRYVLMEH